MLPCRQRLDEKLLHEVALKDIGFELRQQDEWQKHQSADQGAIKQYGNDGIVDDGLFLEDVVEAQQYG